MWYRFKVFKKLGVVLMAGFVIFVLVENSGIEIQGRKNEPISTDFVIRHIYSIAGIEDEGVVGAARGVPQRLGWWEGIFDKLMANNYNFFFGLGYGEPLIDFKGEHRQVVREPHNSLVSAFGRLGLVGGLLIILGHLLLFRSWYGAFQLCRQRGYSPGQDHLIILLVYFVMILIFSIGEDAFEKPFLIIPYYFFWGVVLQYRLQLMKMLEPTESITTEGPASPNVKNDNTIVGAGY